MIWSSSYYIPLWGGLRYKTFCEKLFQCCLLSKMVVFSKGILVKKQNILTPPPCPASPGCNLTALYHLFSFVFAALVQKDDVPLQPISSVLCWWTGSVYLKRQRVQAERRKKIKTETCCGCILSVKADMVGLILHSYYHVYTGCRMVMLSGAATDAACWQTQCNSRVGQRGLRES